MEEKRAKTRTGEKHVLTMEDRIKGGQTVTELRRQTNAINPLKHGRYSKTLSIRRCSLCHFKEVCHANNEHGENRCKLDIFRFKSMLSVGLGFNLRDFAKSYITLLNSLLSDMFDVVDTVGKLNYLIKNVEKDLEREKSMLGNISKNEEFEQRKRILKLLKNLNGYLRTKEAHFKKLYFLKIKILEKIKEGKIMILGDKVIVEQKEKPNIIIEEFKETIKLLVEKYQIEEGKKEVKNEENRAK